MAGSIETIAASRRIAASPERVWEVVSDFGHVADHNPAIATSVLMDGSPDRGPGARRHCELHAPGAWVQESVVEWDEDERVFVARIDRGTGKPPLGDVLLAFRVEAAEPGGSLAQMEIRVAPSNVVQRGMVPAARPMLQRLAENVLHGLEVTATTGRVVGTRADLR